MHVRHRLGASERHACRVLGQPRSTQRRVKKLPGDETALRTDVIRLASRFERWGWPAPMYRGGLIPSATGASA